MTKAFNVIKFIQAQRECSNCYELAIQLYGDAKKESQVRVRINKLREEGYASKLKPYYDLKGNRGRKSIADSLAEMEDYELTTPEYDARQELLELDNEMRCDLAVK